MKYFNTNIIYSAYALVETGVIYGMKLRNKHFVNFFTVG